MNIENWYENLDQPHSGQRVIIALLPNMETMELCRDMNHEVYDCWMDGPGIVFPDHEKASPTSCPHMTIAQMDCDYVDDLLANLDAAMQHRNKPKGFDRVISMPFRHIERYVLDKTGEDTPFIFWWADLPSASLNTKLSRLTKLLFHGYSTADIRPIKYFARPGSLDQVEGLTAAQAFLQRNLGYSHAGLWHLTLGLAVKQIPVHNVLPRHREHDVRFQKLCLAYVGPHGTIAKVIKTWNL